MAPAKAPPRMSGSEVLGCVELVVTAFKQGAELVGRLSRKHKKRKGERNYHEVLLFQVLEQGAKQVQQSYDEGFQRFGSAFKVGDDEARERLLCVAIETNADVVTSLQVACDIEKSTVDLVRLHESAITSRHDAIRSLNDLHQRLEKIRPLGSFSRFSPDSSVCGGGDTRRNSLLLNAPEIHPGTIPPAVTVPQIPERSGLRRMLSAGGSTPHRRAKSDEPNGLRPISSQTSIAPSVANSVLQPAPLYFNSHPAYPRPMEAAPRPVPAPTVTHVRSQSTASAEPKKPTKAGTNKWEDTKDHPDLPDFQFLKQQKTASKHTRAHSSASSQPSKRDSVFSLPSRNSWDTQTTVPASPMAPFTYPANLPPPPPPPVHRPAPSTGIIPMTLVTSLPPTPHHSHHPSLSRPPVTSPIPEDPLDVDTSSVTSRDYDAASVYSQPDEPVISPSVYSPTTDYTPSTPNSDPSDPCTPLTEAPSHGRSSIRSSHSSTPSVITTPSTSGAPSMHRTDTNPTSTRSRASTTVSTMERQMLRGEDGTWRDVPRETVASNLEKAREEQRLKNREKAEKMYRPLHSASISSHNPMSLQLGTFAVAHSPAHKGHSRSRTLDSTISHETAGLGLKKTISSFSQESADDRPQTSQTKEPSKEKKGFWHIRKASKEVVEGAKEGTREKKQRLKEREKRMEWSSMAFAVDEKKGMRKRLSWLG
ncbi:hypothetical protein KVT40_001282 [Elsinoe batatas]|uniref:Uncharacterized protein n=1 Tax=Elsinoe batatas TaxID=2601811 RepID=A0A8K0LAX6_9PEZI|nr:hypothetical protein KVT40_001282 [Elsinoe batatas]